MGNSEGMETVWQGGKRKRLKAAVSGKNSIVQQHLIVERLFEQQDHRLKAPPAAPSADSAHCFSPLFPEDVGQALLPKR